MRKHILTLTLALTTVVIGASARGDDNRSVHIEAFEGHIVFCAPQQPPIREEVLPDGRVRLTFVNEGNVWLTGNPSIDGIETNTSVATVSPDGDTDVRQRGKVEVAAVNGLWRFRQRIFISAETGVGYGLGFGQGELRGKMMLFETGSVGLVPETPCGVPFGVSIKGKILNLRRGRD